MSSEPKRRVEADEFVLRDANGSMRAALAMTVDGPGLFLYDQSGITRARLLIGQDEPGMALFDSLGRPRVSLGLVADEPTLRLQDAEGASRAAIMVEEKGTRLMLSDANAGSRVGIAAQSGESNMVFADPNGKPRIVLGNPGGVPGLTLLDVRGRRRAKLEIEEESSTFELYDADGKTSSSRTVVWVEPGLHAADLEAKLALEAAAHKQLEGALQSKEKRYTALAAATAQLVWTTNAAGEIIDDIPLWRSFTGQTEEEVKGLGWVQALHPEDRERAEGVSKQALETHSAYDTEYRVLRQDGEYRDFAVRAVPVLQDDEAVGEWVVFATDISERKRLEQELRAREERLNALTAAKAQIEEAQRTSEETYSAERQRLEEELRGRDERLASLTAAKTQLEEMQRRSDEGHSAERKRLEDALRASEEHLSVLTATRAQLEEALRAGEEQRNALTLASTQLQESLRASEDRLAAITSAKAQLEETQQKTEADHTAERNRLEEALRMTEEHVSELTASKTQLEESLRASEEHKNSLALASAQLQESLRAKEDDLAAVTAAKAQVEETQQKHTEEHTAERNRLEEALHASEERLSALSASKAQLEEALRASEERITALTVAGAQLQESLRTNEERLITLTAVHAQLEETQRQNEEAHAAERKGLDESLQASEQRLAALAADKAQVEETHRKSQEVRATERKWLEEALRVGEERLSALTDAKSQLEETQRRSDEAHATDRKRLEETLRASEERLGDLTAEKVQLDETLRASRESFAAGRAQWEEALRASEEQLNDQIVAKGQVEEKLRGREEHYRALSTATARLVWTTDAAGEMIQVAPTWTTFTGQSAAEAHGRGWIESLHAEDREGAAGVLKQALEARGPYKTEYRLRRHDGEYRVLAVRGAPVIDEDGAVREWVAAATDITEDKQAETSRRATEKKYRQIVEGAPEGIWILDSENRTTFANPRMGQLLGRSDEEMAGKSLLDFLDEEGRATAIENLACCRQGVAAQFDLKLRTLDGHDLRTRASTLPLFDEAGQYSGALALIIDLTEQKLLEGQMQHAEKLQALGQLAGGVAHGLNNFLTVINGYTDLLLGKVPRSNPLHESVAQIKKAGEQAVGLVAPLLAFSQGQILWAKVLDVNEVVKEAEATLRARLGDEIRLTTVLSPTLGPVKADPEQLQQVLMNLATNAHDAMRSGGSLVIETQNADLDESYAAKHPGVKPGPYVHLTVTDSGSGMSSETLAHLFEPFYTTKTQGQGLGLGLATVYGIVKQSGGSLWVESELGKGTTFHIYLPRIGETEPLAEEGKPGASTLRGTETVLVVDDQEEIRKLAQVVLKSNGYKVVVAANGWEALLYSERHAGPIHLMLTDVVMPGMTGQELAERLRPLRPEMAVVFMSGYLENGPGQPGNSSGSGFISKPFSPDSLATKVREVLGPPRSAGKVLVIDDEAGIRSFLRMILVSVGYEVLESTNAEEALKNLNGEIVDLILVNLGIPNHQDMEKIRMLQKRHPDLKVIAMSEAYGNEFLRAAEQLGAQATLAKPIRADQLLETLRRTATD
jgi:PAS domain S-box-containing protein